MPYPYDDWWFSPQSNTLDPQIFSQPESINAGDDLLYSSDLSSYSTESGKDFFNSAEKSTISDSPTLLAYTNDLNLPTTEDSMFGSDNPTAYESQGSFTDLTYPLGPVDTLASAGDNWIPTPENPCPSLQTLCCPKIQHWPIVSVEPCEQCMSAFGKLLTVLFDHLR